MKVQYWPQQTNHRQWSYHYSRHNQIQVVAHSYRCDQWPGVTQAWQSVSSGVNTQVTTTPHPSLSPFMSLSTAYFQSGRQVLVGNSDFFRCSVFQKSFLSHRSNSARPDKFVSQYMRKFDQASHSSWPICTCNHEVVVFYETSALVIFYYSSVIFSCVNHKWLKLWVG